MPSDYVDQQGAHALDENLQSLRLEGYGVLSGGEAQVAGGYDITLTQTEAYFAGSEVSADAKNVNLQQYVADDPRKVLLCINDAGAFTVEDGDPEPTDPSDEIRKSTNRPAPPDLAGRNDVIPLWEVWVDANTTEIVDNDIFHDRRIYPDLRVHELVAAGVDTEYLIDGAGVKHAEALADLADVRTDSEIRGTINDDPNHGSREAGVGASHDFWTALDTVTTVNDEDELTVDITGDANTVDGLHARDLAEVGHDHDSRYLNDDAGTVAESNLAFDPFTYAEYLQTLGEVVASIDEMLTGGQDPALKTVVQDTTAASDANLDVEVTVRSQPGFAADYGYSTEFEQIWDDSVGAWDVEVTVSWGENPGSGNDVPVTVDVIERGDRTDPLPADSSPNDHTNPTYDSNEDGTIDAPVDSPSVRGDVVDAQELSVTSTLNNEHRILPGATVSDIQTAMASPGTVVFEPGEHILSDRIKSQSPGVTVEIKSGAHIKIADGASPTQSPDSDPSRTALFYVVHDNFSIENKGVMDGNNTNHDLPNVAFFDTVEGGGLDSKHGRVIDTHDCIYIVDSSDAEFHNIHYKQQSSERIAVLATEGCENIVATNISAVDTGETVDLNGINQDIQLSNIRGKNLNDQVLDINGSQDVQAQNVQSIGTCGSIFTLSGTAGPHFSSKTPFGASSDITINGITGEASNKAIHLGNSQEMNNVTITGMDVTATGTGEAVFARGQRTGMLDGLRLEGRAEAQDARAVWIGEYPGGTGAQQVGAHLDVEAISPNSDGVVIADFSEVSGQIYSHDCGGTGTFITNQDATAKDGSLDMLLVNNTNGLVFGGTASDVTGWNITGTIKGNSDTDVHVNTNNNRISTLHETQSDDGTGNTFV